MFSYIAYAIVAFVAALALTLIGVVVRPLKNRDEQCPGRTLITLFIVALIVPYLAAEVMTRTVGKEMKDAVEKAYDEARFQGPMMYYKVILYTGSKAKALAVGKEKQEWGGMDRPIMQVSLTKKNDKWVCDSYRVVCSDRLNKDGIVFPPYW